jgi:hypothetical protein
VEAPSFQRLEQGPGLGMAGDRTTEANGNNETERTQAESGGLPKKAGGQYRSSGPSRAGGGKFVEGVVRREVKSSPRRSALSTQCSIFAQFLIKLDYSLMSSLWYVK